MLYGATDQDLARAGLSRRVDRTKIMLCAWLHSSGQARHPRPRSARARPTPDDACAQMYLCEKLVTAGCRSLEGLTMMSEDDLRKAGVHSLGGRRRLMRLVNDELSHLAVVDEEAQLNARPPGAGGAEQTADELENDFSGLNRSLDGLEQKLAIRDTWQEPWKTTSAACLLGVEPGGSAELCAVRPPPAVRIVCAGGEELVVDTVMGV